MSDRRKNTVMAGMLVLLVALAGCGRSGDGKQSPAAAIGGQGSASPTTGGQGPSVKSPPPTPCTRWS